MLRSLVGSEMCIRDRCIAIRKGCNRICRSSSVRVTRWSHVFLPMTSRRCSRTCTLVSCAKMPCHEIHKVDRLRRRGLEQTSSGSGGCKEAGNCKKEVQVSCTCCACFIPRGVSKGSGPHSYVSSPFFLAHTSSQACFPYWWSVKAHPTFISAKSG